MPFSYVLIPCDADQPMQELEFADVECLEKDSFRSYVEEYFKGMGKAVDRNVLLEQLQQRTGMDLKAKAESGEVPAEAMERLLSASSCEIFPVMMPTKNTGFEAVSIYLDDKGVSKSLPENTRAAGLVQACGFPGQTFKGDCFLGKVFDDTEDVWKRIPMTLADCSTDATWVKMCKEQRSNRSASDMTSMATKMGVNNAAHVNPGMLADSAPKGETDQYTWTQGEDELEVTFKKEGLIKGDKKAVKVTFKKSNLKVEAKGEVLIDAELHSSITPDECTWTLSDGVLQVTLAKASDDQWQSLVKK